MRYQQFRLIVRICVLVSVAIAFTACDSDFFLSEKEFYAIRWQFADQVAANQLTSGVQGQLLRITFNNSVSPPRIQSTNLASLIRANMAPLAILEGYPNNSFQIDRVSGEIERQFDNWVSAQLRLYSGVNNAQVRLERVEELRIQFLTNPAFTYAGNKIIFNVTLQMTGDCRIRVDALDAVTNFLFGGVNGTFDLSIDINNLQLQGELTTDQVGDHESGEPSNLKFKLVPTVGSVAVRDRGPVVPTLVKNGIRDTVRQSLRSPIQETFWQQYDHFSVSNCRIENGFSCRYTPRPTTAAPELHAVARGTDNKLYSATRRDDVWSGYTELCCTSPSGLQILFTTDPSLAVSSPSTVELAATTASGEIYYAQYQNGWKNTRFILPPSGSSFRGKPAIVATAPGQVEIFVLRADNKVVHLRRINGNWTTPVLANLPATIGTIPNITWLTYRDPIAVQSGNKIFLTAVASNNRLFGALYDLETGAWAAGAQIASAETIRYAPALASGGDGRIDLAYVGNSGNTFHRPLTVNVVNIAPGTVVTGFALSPEVTLPSSVTATPVLVASGFRQLGLVARGTDNRLYYNHFTGPQSPTGMIDGRTVGTGWSGWTGLNGNFIGTQNLSNEYTEEYALTGTKSGKLDLVARIRANTFSTAYTLHHNAFDAMDYGHQPWKTINWRGYQKVGAREFSGRPALAALDHNFGVAFVGQGNNLYESQYGYDFAGLVGFQVLSNPAPVDPVLVSSGKGLMDLIVVGTDRKLRHVRYQNGWGLQSATLPGQTNLLFQSRPAVAGYGDGQMDVVGVTTAGAIHHWRYINGAWRNPVIVSGTVSSPVLVGTGSGQLELFAIGGDNKMYRWRFTGGVWGNWQGLPSAFTIQAPKFGPGSAVTAGDGSVDLVVVSSQAGAPVYHRYVEPRDDTVSLPGLPAQTFRSIGSGANSQAFIGVINKTEKFAITGDVNSSNFRYFSLNNSTNWQTTMISGRSLGLQIGGIASLPNGGVVVATGLNGRLYYHDRFTAASPRFDFIPVKGQSMFHWLPTPRYRPTVASFAGQ